MYRLKLIFILLIIFTSFAKAQPGNVSGAFTTAPGLLNGALVFTVEFWVRTTESRSNPVYWQRPYLFGNTTNGDNSGDFGITTNNGFIGMWEGISNKNTDQVFLSPYVRINDNLWHHIAAVNTGATISLFVDGNVVGSLVSGRPVNTRNAPLTFGASSLDYNWPGNSNTNTNFPSQASFGEARFSRSVRYIANFIPEQSYNSDPFTVELYHFGSQFTSAQAPPQPSGNMDAYAQQATLYIGDTALTGRLSLGKKNFSLGNDLYIRFAEGNSHDYKYFRPEEIKAYQVGDSYFEPKFLGPGGSVNTSLVKTMVKRLTPLGSRMVLYQYENHTSTKNAAGVMEYKTEMVYFVQLPNTADDKIYQFSDNKFTPHFDTKVSAFVQDKPALVDKIKKKNKDYFYAFITETTHQVKVWQNIADEYNAP